MTDQQCLSQMNEEDERILAKRAEIEKQRLEQEEREKMIGEAYKLLGRIEATKMFTEFGEIAGLVWLKQVRENKIYKNIPEIKTWDNFCNSLGFSRRTVEDKLSDINFFGEKFLGTIAGFSIGYRELRKLRYAAEQDELVIEDDVIKVGGDVIPLDQEHTEDIKAAIDSILEETDRIKRENERLKKEHAAVIEEETKTHKTEKAALVKELKRLKAFDPEDKDPKWCVEQVETLEKIAGDFEMACRKTIFDPRIANDGWIIGKVSGLMNQIDTCFSDLRRTFEDEFFPGGR